MTEIHELTPDQALELEWLRRRQGGIGSSDSAVIYLGEVWKRDRVALYLDKVRALGPTDVLEGLANPAFVRGHFYEPNALALLEGAICQRVHQPVTAADRYGAYMLRDPGRPWLFADLDGLCADGWIAEAKAPTQRNADGYRRDGVPDHNLIQGQHLIHVVQACADAGLPLPGLGIMPPGWRCPGVRFAVYEPDNIAIQQYEVPPDEQVIAELVERDRAFWFDHVEPRRPPLDELPEAAPAAPKPKRVGGQYAPVEGPAWAEPAAAFAAAYRQRRDLEAQLEAAKAAETAARQPLVAAMAAAQIEGATVAGWRFLSRMGAGRKAFDRKRLAAEHPEIDLRRYDTPGKPAPYWRVYAPGEEPEAEEG